ncbi:MAG: hypothetical protein R3302_03005 [Sulfurimonadaceae bacterium]|nr:hypothetical protein [Sulfurimonadaceae bacterium]
MYRVEVKNPCKCFLKSGNVEMQTFPTKEEAREEAERMLEQMQTTFCQKHQFVMSELVGNFTITIKPS